VQTAENFYTSIGFAALPQTFWTRSLFIRRAIAKSIAMPRPWDIDGKDDVRIKTCLRSTPMISTTAHHELGSRSCITAPIRTSPCCSGWRQ